MAFYRKWRPQTLSEVVGQEHVTRTLLNALQSNRVSHAYLFCGPRGTGKTSTGRILAKAVNCNKAATSGKDEPCNQCSMCMAITEGRAMDVIEIDAASNRGIDQMRELRERITYAPAEANFKVYIIDEVHMLTPEASNALLKTLEEPPPKVIFVLATTETHKVLPTIISRCQRFDFHRLSRKDTEQKLLRIADAEGISMSPEALQLISRSARGGLRDAENLLEQLYTYYGNGIGLEQVQSLLGLGNGEQARQLVGFLVKKDLLSALKIIDKAQYDGLDLRQMNLDIVDYLHALLLEKSSAGSGNDRGKEESSEIAALARAADLGFFLKALKLFGGIQRELGDSSLPMELAMLDALDMPGHPVTESSAKGQNLDKEPTANSICSGGSKSPAPAVNTLVSTRETSSPSPKQADNKVPISKTAFRTPVEPTPVSTNGSVPLTGNRLEQLRNSWRQIIEQAPDNLKRSPAVAILRSAGVVPIAVDEGTVTLSFKYNIHKEKIENLENKRIVSGLLSQFLGHTCKIKCVYEPAENHLVREAQKLGAQVIEIEDKI
jgi:DNA polymerase-3 subunit gamma/tau